MPSASEQLTASGRMPWPLFFLMGSLLTIVTWVLESHLLRGADFPQSAWVPRVRLALLASPWALALFLVVQRARARRRYPWLAYSIGAGLPWVLLFGLFLGPSLMEYLRRTAFDSKAWKEAAWVRGSAATGAMTMLCGHRATPIFLAQVSGPALLFLPP